MPKNERKVPNIPSKPAKEVNSISSNQALYQRKYILNGLFGLTVASVFINLGQNAIVRNIFPQKLLDEQQIDLFFNAMTSTSLVSGLGFLALASINNLKSINPNKDKK